MTQEFARATGETYGGEGGLRSVLARTPFIGELLRGRPPKIPHYDSAQRPTASLEQRHAILIVPGAAGVADVVYVCRKTAADTYEWVDVSTPLTQGSSTSDLKDDLVANGIVADGGATPLNLDSGALTAGAITGTTGHFTGNMTMDLDATARDVTLRNMAMTGTLIGFFNHSVAAKPTVTGSRGGNAALASLLTGLAGLGLITDSST